MKTGRRRVREVYVRQVRAELGELAGRRARTALVLRGISTVGWVLGGVWLVVLLLGSGLAWSRGDEHDVLFSRGWWGWLVATGVLVAVGVVGRALSGYWSRQALGELADETRIIDVSYSD